MKRSRVRPGSVYLCVLLLALGGVGVASAASPTDTNYWFAGSRLVFDHPQARGGALAVAIDDPALQRFLQRLNATVAYQPGQNVVFVTTGDRRSVSFTIGDPSVTVDGTPQAAAFGPYGARGSVFVPFVDLARALGVDPVADAGSVILQPQISNVNVRTENNITYVTVHGASALTYKRLSDPNDEHVSLVFSATSSPLDRERELTSPALRSLTITVAGTPKYPTTQLDFDGVSGGTHAIVASGSPNAVEIAFAAPGVALDAVPATIANGPPQPAGVPVAPHVAGPPALAAPLPGPAGGTGPSFGGTSNASAPSTATPTADTLSPAAVTGITTDGTDTGYNVHLAITGPVTFEWHRLADLRWYVDLKPATLTIAPQDTQVGDEAVDSLRIKPFTGPSDQLPTVRVGMTLTSPRVVTLVPTPGGVTIAVGEGDDTSAIAAGSGEFANGQTMAIVPLPPPPGAAPQPWKFSPVTPAGPVARNPRLIVIDPGHGGSDAGSMHNGLVEKDLTLDMSRRLRAALIARGWQVKMTRDSDVDVYQPNDSGRDELQARDDIANNAGARFLISVHVNAFTSSDLNGTTTYYYKEDSVGLAGAVHGRLASELPTADDGIHKENFYVIRHTTMPSILVETAFDSNAGDAALLRSDAFKNQVAQAIAAGVGDYTKGTPASSPIMDGQ